MKKLFIIGLMFLLLPLVVNALDTSNIIGFYPMTTNCSENVAGADATNNGAAFINSTHGCDLEATETDYINIDNIAGAWIDTAGSICVWWERESSIAWQHVIAFTDPGTDLVGIGENAANQFILRTKLGAPGNEQLAAADNAYGHKCMTWDNDAHVAGYINGSNVGNNSDNNLALADVSDGLIGAYDYAPIAGFADGKIMGIIVWDDRVTPTEVAEVYAGGRNYNPFSVATNHSLESTSVINQVGSVNINSASYTTVLNGTFNITNATYAVGSWTVEVDNRQTTDISCRGLIDGNELNTETNRTFSGTNQLASLFLLSENTTVGVGEHWAAIQCKKNVGVSFFTVSNTNTIIHILSNDQSENISFMTDNINVNITSASYTKLGTFDFKTSNITLGSLNMSLVFEASVEYNYVSESNISCLLEVDGVNSTAHIRYGGAGSIGSGGEFYIDVNVTPNTNITFNLYGKSSSADGNLDINFVVKEFVADDDEVGIDSSSSTVVTNVWSIIDTIQVNNSNHALANLVSKSVNSFQSQVGTQTISLMLGDDVINGTVLTRSIEDVEPGVIVLQEVFQDVGVGVHNVYLWGITSSGNALRDNGTTITYVTDDVPFSSTSFEVGAFDSWDNSSIAIFNVTNSVGTIFNTTIGVVNVSPTGPTETIIIQALDYFNATISNHNSSNDLNVSLNQSLISFNASIVNTGSTLSGVSFNVTDGTLWEVGTSTDIFNLKAGIYNVTGSKAGYFDKTQGFTVVALDNITVTVVDMFTTNLTIVPKDAFTNATLTEANITLSFGAWSQTFINVSNASFNTSEDFSYTLEIEVEGYVDLTESISGFGSGNVTLFAQMFKTNSATFNFFDEDFNVMNQTVNSTLFNGFGIFNFNTSTGTINIENITTGTYTLISSTAGFNDVSIFVTVAAGSHQTVNVYFNDLTLKNKTFNVFDGGINPVGGAVISFTRLINGTTIVVEQIITDFSGSARAQLSEITLYGIVVSKTSFTTFTGNVTPIADVYTISLLSANIDRFTSTFDDIVYSSELTYVFNNSFGDMQFEIFSASGFLQYFGMNFTYLAVPYSVNISGVPGGGVININITNVDVTLDKLLNVTFWFKSVNHSFTSWDEQFYFIDVIPADGSLTEGLFDSSGMSDSLKASIAGFIILALVILGFSISKNGFIGALMGFIGVGLMWWKEFLPRNLSVIAMIVIAIVFVADMKRKGGNL